MEIEHENRAHDRCANAQPRRDRIPPATARPLVRVIDAACAPSARSTENAAAIARGGSGAVRLPFPDVLPSEGLPLPCSSDSVPSADREERNDPRDTEDEEEDWCLIPARARDDGHGRSGKNEGVAIPVAAWVLAAATANLPALRSMYECGAPPPSDLLDVAAASGSVECVRFLREECRLPWGSWTVGAAARSGDAACLHYVVANRCPWSAADLLLVVDVGDMVAFLTEVLPSFGNRAGPPPFSHPSDPHALRIIGTTFDRLNTAAAGESGMERARALRAAWEGARCRGTVSL